MVENNYSNGQIAVHLFVARTKEIHRFLLEKNLLNRNLVRDWEHCKDDYKHEVSCGMGG